MENSTGNNNLSMPVMNYNYNNSCDNHNICNICQRQKVEWYKSCCLKKDTKYIQYNGQIKHIVCPFFAVCLFLNCDGNNWAEKPKHIAAIATRIKILAWVDLLDIGAYAKPKVWTINSTAIVKDMISIPLRSPWSFLYGSCNI